MTWNYSEKTTQLFMDAVQGKPGTHLGEIENPDGIGEHGSIACGDALRFSFRVERHPEDPLLDKIVEARYLTFGCTSAIAASEAMCRLVEEGDLSPMQALSITNQDIVNYLGGLPQAKVHCSVMGAEALEAAVFDWARKRNVPLSSLGIDIRKEEQEEGRLVCSCFGLTEPYLRRKIKELELRTITEIIGAVKAGGGCMSCHHTPGGLQDLLDETWGRPADKFGGMVNLPVAGQTATPATKGERTPFRFAKDVERVIDDVVRPHLAKDGGDLELIDIKGTVVYCRFLGDCATCAGSSRTLKTLVEHSLRTQVDEKIRVIGV
ncbi:MAG: iron-sulfur cluster assembly scaffold protein [Thermoanaerobaculales bacterium]|nr:iron-sulfur cluster assembly scaffold protein [Thermoanaerobaculales bacterium]